MRITVQVAPDIARKLNRGGSLGKACSELNGVLNNFSVKLVPLHPGINDEALGSYFAVEVPDSETAKTVVRYLRPCRGIRAAYIKPADALPKL
jgi:hypothetical protein